jgi:hypothetical protein
MRQEKANPSERNSLLKMAEDFYKRGQHHKAKALIYYCLNVGLIDKVYVKDKFPQIIED